MRHGLVPGLAIFVLGLLLPAGRALAGEPWYRDVTRSHWAYQFIRVLWEEEVTDGYPGPRGTGGRPRWASFRPDRPVTRAEFTLMTDKAFRLPPAPDPRQIFRDVPPTLTLYGRIPALPWIEAARLAGVVSGDGNGFFHPEHPTERQQAVAILVRALGLAPFAVSMTDKEAGQYLKTFRDWRGVDRSLFKEIALAVKLRIVIGYPDGTLKPSADLTRAEAATILYRSALFTLSAAPNPFSPDGDGIDDETAFQTRTLKNRNAVRWQAYVGTIGGRVFRTFNRTRSGAPSPSFPWDGRDDRGRSLAPGTYYYWGWIEDRQGQRFEAVRKPIVLEHKTLRGTAQPRVVAPGDTLLIRADTTGRATRVAALWPDGRRLPLSPVDPPGAEVNRWRLDWQVPANAADGDYSLLLRAEYDDGATRQVSLAYRVQTPLFLRPTLDPNPAAPGTTVTAECDASANMGAVVVAWPWGETTRLTPRGETWRGAARIPPGFLSGRYPVKFTGTAGARRAEEVVTLKVRVNPLADVDFVLTD